VTSEAKLIVEADGEGCGEFATVASVQKDRIVGVARIAANVFEQVLNSKQDAALHRLGRTEI
jgi:hypothetical protein